MNKNSNSYQIIYSAIMVVLVGAVLALIYMNLKPKQDVNIANDTRSQILSALHIAVASDDEIPATYEKYITQDLLVDLEGNVLDSAKNCAFDVDMKKNMKLDENERNNTIRLMKVKDMMLEDELEEKRRETAEMLEKYKAQ